LCDDDDVDDDDHDHDDYNVYNGCNRSVSIQSTPKRLCFHIISANTIHLFMQEIVMMSCIDPGQVRRDLESLLRTVTMIVATDLNM
jgi:hypothetical protein